MKRSNKTLGERIGLVSPSPADVQILVASPDATAEMVKGAAAVAATVQSLADERNQLMKKCEYLQREIVFLRNVNARVEDEREYWRKQAALYIRSNGELAATLVNMFKLAEVASGSLQTAQALADRMPQPGAAEINAPIPQKQMQSYDEKGIPISQALYEPISLDEIGVEISQPKAMEN